MSNEEALFEAAADPLGWLPDEELWDADDYVRARDNRRERLARQGWEEHACRACYEPFLRLVADDPPPQWCRACDALRCMDCDRVGEDAFDLLPGRIGCRGCAPGEFDHGA